MPGPPRPRQHVRIAAGPHEVHHIPLAMERDMAAGERRVRILAPHLPHQGRQGPVGGGILDVYLCVFN